MPSSLRDAAPSTPLPTVSLLHATCHAAQRAIAVRETWLATAARGDLVEHVFAMDADDSESIAATQGLARVISPALGGAVTAVRNWNAAAASARGDLLFVIADDLYPSPEWDTSLRRVIGELNPLTTAFAVKIDDGRAERPTLLRHPVVSRRFYACHGLFCPLYSGVYCDDDLSTCAFQKAVIIDGRQLRCEHRSPSCDDLKESYSRRHLNRPEEYERGWATYRARWSRRQREAPHIMLRVEPEQRLSDSRLLAIRSWFNARSSSTFWVDRGCAALRKAGRMLCRAAPRPPDSG